MLNAGSRSRSLQRSKIERAVFSDSSSWIPNGRASSMWVQSSRGFRSVYGTVRAQASNFSQSDASPAQNRSGTPLVRIARHLS